MDPADSSGGQLLTVAMSRRDPRAGLVHPRSGYSQQVWVGNDNPLGNLGIGEFGRRLAHG